MNDLDFLYQYENLQVLDPDQLVSDLGLTTQQILDAFPLETERFINKEFG